MKKLLALTVIMSMLIASGCSKDDDDPAGPNGGGGKTTISGTIDNWTLGTGKTISLSVGVNSLSMVYGSATVAENGSFSFEAEWPETAAPLWYAYPDDPECPGTVTVNAQDAYFMLAHLVVSNGSEVIAYVSQQVGEDTSSGSLFFYVSKDASITGSETCSGSTPSNYSVNMTQGWNLVYEYSNDNGDQLTTTAPAGAKYVLYSLDF